MLSRRNAEASQRRQAVKRYYSSYLIETAINTLKTDNVELPDTAQARGVKIVKAWIGASTPGKVASTLTSSIVALLRGKVTVTSLTSGPPLGTSHMVVCEAYSDATPDYSVVVTRGSEMNGDCNIDIPKSPDDGRYYITRAVQGAANGAGQLQMGIFYIEYLTFLS